MTPEADQAIIDREIKLNTEVQAVLYAAGLSTIDDVYQRLFNVGSLYLEPGYELEEIKIFSYIAKSHYPDKEVTSFDILLTNPQTLSELYSDHKGKIINEVEGWILLLQSPQIKSIQAIEINLEEYIVFRSIEADGKINFSIFESLLRTTLNYQSEEEFSLDQNEQINLIRKILKDFYSKMETLGISSPELGSYIKLRCAYP